MTETTTNSMTETMSQQTILNYLKNPNKYISLYGKVPLNSFDKKTKTQLDNDITNNMKMGRTITGLSLLLENNVIVIDFDLGYDDDGKWYNSVPENRTFIDTCKTITKVVESPSGGFHVYFKLRKMFPAKKKPDNIDLQLPDNNKLIIQPESISMGCVYTDHKGVQHSKIKCKSCYDKKDWCDIKGRKYKLLNDLDIMEIDLEQLPNELEYLFHQLFDIKINENTDHEDVYIPSNFEDKEGFVYGKSLDTWETFIQTLEPLAYAPYEDWLSSCMCIFNIFENYPNDRINFIHMFSKLAPEKYDRSKVNSIINGFSDKCDKKVKLTTLLNLCEQYGIDTSSFIQVRKLSDQQKLDNYLNSNYYWYDFCKDASKDIFESRTMLMIFLQKNLHKVLFSITGEDGYYIKIDKDEKFHYTKNINKTLYAKYKYIEEDRDGNLVVKIAKTYLCQLIASCEYIHYYSKLIFDPSKQKDERNMNMFQGFKSKLLIPDDIEVAKIQPILDHIKLVWCNDNIEYYNYMISWFQHIFKTPHIKTRVVPILQSSEQQIGKGIIITGLLIPFIFGDMGIQCNDINRITHRFNMMLMNKLFINMDELTDSSGTNNYNGTFDMLKNLITEPFLTIEIKNGSTFQNPNFINFLMCTNHLFTIKFEMGDNRYWPLECNPIYKGNRDYFDRLSTYFTQENADHFFSYCYYFKDTVNIRNIPMTELKKSMIDQNLPTPLLFLKEIQDDEVILSKTTENTIDAASFYLEYAEWCKTYQYKPLNATRFGGCIAKYITKKRSNGIKYDISTISL